MREQTEWVELIDIRVNELVGANSDKKIRAVTSKLGIMAESRSGLYGGGQAAERIVNNLKQISNNIYII